MNFGLFSADAARLPLPDGCVDLVLGSPPYLDARTYGISAQRKCQAWIDWMLDVTAECVRVSRGLVIWVCAGVTRKWVYQPGPEGLLYEWWKRGGYCWRPAFWHRCGIPGSGGKQWLRADVEYVLCFSKCPKKIPWAENAANGHPPKWAPGGEMSHRLSDGTKRNQWGGSHSADGRSKHEGDVTKNNKGQRPSHKLEVNHGRGVSGGRGKVAMSRRRPNGTIDGRRISRGHDTAGDTTQADAYVPPKLANPGNLIKGIHVGGGHMGHELAHKNEAPYPVDLARWFIRGWCPPFGTVYDPFIGSGTTAHAALTMGRSAFGSDLRLAQVQIARQRCETITPSFLELEIEDVDGQLPVGDAGDR